MANVFIDNGSMVLSIKLNNCPFCGGDAHLTHEVQSYEESYPNGSVIKCDNCGAYGPWFPVHSAYSSDEKAVKAWNNRIEQTS